jgi:hypothetical protein
MKRVEQNLIPIIRVDGLEANIVFDTDDVKTPIAAPISNSGQWCCLVYDTSTTGVQEGLSDGEFKAVRATLRCFTSHSQPTTLRQPMGKWLIDPTTKWRWFYRAEDQSLFHHNENGLWDHYQETIPLRRTQSTDKVFHVCQANLDAPPIGDLIFASIKRALSYTTTAPAILITHLGDSSYILQQTPAPTPDCSNWTTMDYLDQCLPSESWALDRLTPPQGDDFHLAAAVRAGTAVAAMTPNHNQQPLRRRGRGRSNHSATGQK